MQKKFLILADSSWQIDWVRRETGYLAGPAFGGINLRMFHAIERQQNKKIKIIYSGDPRERKGTDTVEKAIELLKLEFSEDEVEFDSYWNRKFSQEQLVNFYQSGDIFLDGHRRAGWCNPVAEAIACGCVPVCTRIGANQDFAINNGTAMVVDVDNQFAMARDASILIHNPVLRQSIRQDGLAHIKNFSYEKVVPLLERTFVRTLHDPA